MSGKEYIEELRERAEQGDAKAQYELGSCYERGKGVERNHEQAVEWFSRAAEQDFGPAKATISKFKDVARMRELAELGDAISQYQLGKYYFTSADSYVKRRVHLDEAAESFGKAAEWLGKAAEQGHAEAQYYLGCLYGRGRGVEKDLERAFELFGKAAGQGDEHARKALEEKSKFEADFADLRERAEKGDAEAQYNLGMAYKSGETFVFSWGYPIDKDPERGVEWLRRAAEQGHELAKRRLIVRPTGRVRPS